MRYAVLVQRRADGKYQASVPMIPGLTRVAENWAKALQEIQNAISEALTSTEVVYLNVPTEEVQVNPWLVTAGMFADDPTLEPMLAEIYAARDAE